MITRVWIKMRDEPFVLQGVDIQAITKAFTMDLTHVNLIDQDGRTYNFVLSEIQVWSSK